jgi:hypothetical protein
MSKAPRLLIGASLAAFAAVLTVGYGSLMAEKPTPKHHESRCAGRADPSCEDPDYKTPEKPPHPGVYDESPPPNPEKPGHPKGPEKPGDPPPPPESPVEANPPEEIKEKYKRYKVKIEKDWQKLEKLAPSERQVELEKLKISEFGKD